MIKKLIEKLYWKYCSEDLSGLSFKSDDADKLLKAVASIKGYRDFLKSIARADKERYFHAQSDMERELIKGSYQRTVYLYRLLLESKVDEEEINEISKPRTKSSFRIGGRYE